MDFISKNAKRNQVKTIFITGVNGLLGTNLVHELIKQDYIIYAIIRNKNKYVGRKSKNLHLITMDLWGDYDEYLKKSDVVVHIAAETSTNKLTIKDYNQINYKATKRLFEHAEKQKVSKFIFISTANTIGFGDKTNPGTEEIPSKKPFKDLFYAQSKAKAENYLLTKKSSMQVSILNPTFIIGPFDSKPSSGKIILMALGKPFVFYPPGGKNFVPVKDVCQAIIKCFSLDKSKQKFLIAGENLSYKEFFIKLKEITGEQQILLPIPTIILAGIGKIGDILQFFKIPTSLHSLNMQVLRVNNFYSSEKSIKDLQLEYSSLNKAIAEAVRYFKNLI